MLMKYCMEYDLMKKYDRRDGQEHQNDDGRWWSGRCDVNGWMLSTKQHCIRRVRWHDSIHMNIRTWLFLRDWRVGFLRAVFFYDGCWQSTTIAPVDFGCSKFLYREFVEVSFRLLVPCSSRRHILLRRDEPNERMFIHRLKEALQTTTNIQQPLANEFGARTAHLEK